MLQLVIDYGLVGVVLSRDPRPEALGDALMTAAAEYYSSAWHSEALQLFEQSTATYLSDFASSDGLPHEDRTVAAWAVTPPLVGRRDAGYQRGFPMDPDPDLPAVDRGHLIPHLSGGEFGPNLFRQDRALNRGWSEQGKRYRRLEREAAATPGMLYFGHLVYTDESDYPARIEIGVVRSGALHVESFDNRPAP